MSVDILNLEWASAGRDREVATMICYALRQRGYSVVEECVFNYKHNLLKYRPKLLYVADPKGARVNYQAIKFARKLGIPAVTFTAEGDYTEEKVQRMFWGHITDHELVEELNLQWSTRARTMVLEVDPSLRDRIKVSGAVGFDRYQIYQFCSQEAWFQKYGVEHPRMIGYATWGFDKLENPTLAAQWDTLYGREQVEAFRQEREQLNQILRQLIEHNPDILFLLKEHPGVANRAQTEIRDLDSCPNVQFVKNEESIGDCINACDVWIAYESTTCLEAWLLGKQTLLINPLGGGFARSIIHKGSPIFSNAAQVQNALDSFYRGDGIIGFSEKQTAREEIISDIMQWADGKNHMRAAYLFNEILRQREGTQPQVTLADRIGALWQNAFYLLGPLLPFLPRFRTYAAARKRFRHAELHELTERYGKYLRDFHQENQLTAHDLHELAMVNESSTAKGPSEVRL